MARLQAVTAIAAAADHVRAILVDLPGYDAWNPFTFSVTSTLESGAPLTMRVRFGPGRERTDHHVVSVVDPLRTQCDCSRLEVRGTPRLVGTQRAASTTQTPVHVAPPMAQHHVRRRVTCSSQRVPPDLWRHVTRV